MLVDRGEVITDSWRILNFLDVDELVSALYNGADAGAAARQRAAK